MISKEQIAHDLAVAFAGQYVGDAVKTEYDPKEMDVYKTAASDLVSVYKKVLPLILEDKGI